MTAYFTDLLKHLIDTGDGFSLIVVELLHCVGAVEWSEFKTYRKAKEKLILETVPLKRQKDTNKGFSKMA